RVIKSIYCLHSQLSDSLHFFFFNPTPPTAIYTLSLHDALPISLQRPTKAAVAPDASCRYCELTHCAPRNATYAGIARFRACARRDVAAGSRHGNARNESVGRLCLETRHVASAPSTASRSPETSTRAAGGASASLPVVDVTVVTSRDDFLLELGQALGGQAGVRPVESPDEALQSM